MPHSDSAPERPSRLAPIGALAGLERATLEALDAAMEISDLEPDTLLFRQGDPADRLFVVLEGRLAIALDAARPGEDGPVIDAGHDLGELGPGDVVGEVAILSGTRRTANARSITAVTIGAIDRAQLIAISGDHPDLVEGLLASSVRRLRRGQLAASLTAILGPLEPAVVDALEKRIEWIRVGGGEVLFERGDPGGSGYIVIEGRLRVITPTAGRREPTITELGRGEPIGTTSLMSGQPRVSTVVAIRDTELARITAETLRWFVEQRPAAAFRIMAALADRLDRATTGLPGPASVAARAATFALLPANGADVTAFARRFGDAIGPYGRALVVSSADVETVASEAGLSGDASVAFPIQHWLGEREAAHAFVVYVADQTLTPWTDQCLRHADHIVVVADAGADPAPGSIELGLTDRWHPRAAPTRTLVLLHPEGVTEPRGTERWLEPRAVDRHLHVRASVDADVARVGRLLTGHGITLVLGGGGARGYAHIGVVRAFEELGIPIDMVGGTSMGALIAGGVARGWQATDGTHRYVESTRRLFDPTLPLVSILSGGHIWKAIEAGFGDVRIEDLVIPFFCVSTNLTRAEPVIHRRGSLAWATRASISLPGILPPIYADGDLLVDGGLLDNLPIAVMRGLNGGGRVVAVDVASRVDVRADERFEPRLSGWTVLRDRLTRTRPRPRLPGIVELLNRVVEVPSIFLHDRNADGHRPDLLIRPPVERWRTLDLRRVEPIERVGYEAALGPLREWWMAEATNR